MAMNVTEATAVNAVLRFLYGEPTPHSTMGIPTEARLREAAAVLADSAMKRLQAGWSGERVRDPRRTPLRIDIMHPEATCRVCGCTEDEACAGNCWWVPDPEVRGDLCSSCAAVLYGTDDPETLQDLVPADANAAFAGGGKGEL